MKPWSFELRGRFDEAVIESEVLQGNPLGDPHERPIAVYIPPGYDDTERRYPSIYVIQGLTGQVDMWRNRAAFRKNFPELLDDLYAGDDAPPPAVVVFVDCWTSLGGSQFLDSPATGRYHTFLCDEVVPWVDDRYRTIAGAEHRGIAGEVVGRVRRDGHADASARPLRRAGHARGGCPLRAQLPARGASGRARPSRRVRGLVRALLGGLPLAARVLQGLRPRAPEPVVPGELVPEVWERWLAWDPVRMVATHADALRSQRAIYIDAGKKDEWFLDLGAGAFRRALAEIGVTDVHLELFDATHMAIEYRYPLGIRYLAERLAPAA